MASSFERYQKRRLISSYFSVVLSIFLVLFLLGTLGLFVINSTKIANQFKERIPMTVYFDKNIPQEWVDEFDKYVTNQVFINAAVFVSKEEAARTHQEYLGENFVENLGVNPLSDSYDLRLVSPYVVSDSLEKISNILRAKDGVRSVNYDKILVDAVNENVKKVSFWILVVSVFFVLIAVLLINSSLRLSIYSNRFIIKTMQMVGATKSFIRRPFIWRNVRLGIIGAVLAMIALYGLLYYIDNHFKETNFSQDYYSITLVFGSMLLFGIFITWFSTYFATQRFLNLRTNDLY
ncbi:MAG: permease-like cell division protein FtsX [Bacteroidota bacterium]|nr:permease-like cell division protein FtsX [Bacteroidota bacterium]